MRNLGLCDSGACALDSLFQGQLEKLACRLRASTGGAVSGEDCRAVAREFASVLYTQIVQEMRKTSAPEEDELSEEEEEEETVKQGVWDFVEIYLPRAIAGSHEDPLVVYLAKEIEKSHGGTLDASA